MEYEYKIYRSALFEFNFFVFGLFIIATIAGIVISIIAKQALFLAIAALFLIAAVIYIVSRIVTNHHYIVEFYQDKVIVKSGVVNTHVDEMVFKGILGVSVDQSLAGKLFNYGALRINVAGKNDMILEGVKNPKAAKEYLLARKVDASTITHTITN